MDIIEYFDNEFKASVKMETLTSAHNRAILVVLGDDLKIKVVV